MTESDVRIGDTVRYSFTGEVKELLSPITIEQHDGTKTEVNSGTLIIENSETERGYQLPYPLKLSKAEKLEILARRPKAIGSLWKHPNPQTSDQSGVFIHLGNDFYTKANEGVGLDGRLQYVAPAYTGGYEFIPATEADIR